MLRTRLAVIVVGELLVGAEKTGGAVSQDIVSRLDGNALWIAATAFAAADEALRRVPGLRMEDWRK